MSIDDAKQAIEAVEGAGVMKEQDAAEFIEEQMLMAFFDVSKEHLFLPATKTKYCPGSKHVELRLEAFLPHGTYRDIKKLRWLMTVSLRKVVYVNEPAMTLLGKDPHWMWAQPSEPYFLRNEIRDGLRQMERQAMQRAEEASKRFAEDC